MADYRKMLHELKTEHEQIGEAILTIERLARGAGKRRGRPPKWMTERKGPGKVGRRPSTEAKTA
jgi:hypothetical protein